MNQELVFEYERETKHTFRYKEITEGKPPAVGTIYIQKWLLGSKPPKNITVTISF